MKSSNRVGVWRPLMGVVVVGGLALGVSALAGPRGSDPASRGGKDKVGTEVTRLVTGDPAQINAVVAGAPPPATALMEIVPVPAKVGAYPAGTSINIPGRSLIAANGGFRAWFEVKVSNWDPNKNGSPQLKGFQFVIDAAGYMSGNGDPLDRAVVACAANAPCIAAFGESFAKCDLTPGSGTINTCNAGYNKGGNVRADSWCHDDGGGCDASDTSTATLSYNWFGIAGLATGRPETEAVGFKYYGGTLVLDVPGGARGKYCVAVDGAQTFLFDTTAPPQDIAVAEKNGFCVYIETGSCCYGLGGGPGVEGCSDKLKAKECGDDETPPSIWTKDKLCSQGCVECVNDDGCNDGDSCTTETCNTALGICVRGYTGAWDIASECCDGSGPNPAISTINDGDDCTCDSCDGGGPPPLPPVRNASNGSAQHIPCLGTCNDGNACTTPDLCDGVRSKADGGCSGRDVNEYPCASDDQCPFDPLGVRYPCSTVDPASPKGAFCFCTLTPKVTFELNSPSEKSPMCDAASPLPGLPCKDDGDCAPGKCDQFADALGANCFDLGSKVTAVVHIGSAGSPINGGEFNIAYDPSCVQYNSATCLAPYTTTVYGPVVNTGTGKIFIACGVDPFAIPRAVGPLGSVNMVSLNFTMIGECSNCELCFQDKNPLHNYLVDDEGQAVNIEPQCKELSAKGVLVLTVPGNIKVNSDCDVPTAAVSWTSPNASFDCGDVNILCRGAHQNGLQYEQARVMGGGVLPQGASSFCCYAWAKDKCDQTAGCPGRVNDCPGTPKPDGCWTVEVNDQTSLDIHVQLEPPIATAGEITRCIEFCLYGACTDLPACFTEDIVFGGLYNFIGKAGGKLKVPKGKWGCITAQDQLHSLRSCTNPDCIDGQLVARFKGDPIYDGNWLLGGNLDAWKKDDPKASLDIIDILDFGMFVSQFGVCYGPGPFGCHDGPNADINGDGCVTVADYNFILRNFLASSKDCCCGPQPGAAAALEEVTVVDRPDLTAADLNGDGVVNGQDMDLFAQGHRPAKSNDRKGTKGLRSGR